MSTSGFRIEQSRNERLALEKSLAAAEQARDYQAAAPQREAAKQQAEHERRELKRLLLTYADESADFQYTRYDGRFPDAVSVENAIRESWSAFLENHDLDSQAQNTVTMFLQLHHDADITLSTTFEQALSYLESRLCVPEVTPVPATTPVAAPEAGTNPFKAGSRDAENWDREQHRQSVLHEKLLGDEYQNALATIQNDARKTLSGPDQVKFLSWYSLPAQRRRFPTMGYFRLAFCEFFNAPETLNDADRDLMAHNRQMNSMTSDDLKRAVGFSKTFNSNGGYAARESQ